MGHREVRRRKCFRCGDEKPLSKRYFYVARRKGKKVAEWSYECIPCARARKKVWMAAALADHQKHAELSERKRKSQKRWREANRQKTRENNQRYKAKVKAEPERHAAFLEARRLEAHLRAERNGRKVTRHHSTAKKIHEPRRTLPSAPFLELIQQRIDLAAEPGAKGIRKVCEELGISERRLFAWRKGEAISLSAAERMLLHL